MQHRSILRCAFSVILSLAPVLAARGQGGFDISKLQLPSELNAIAASGPPAHEFKVTSQILVDRQSKYGLLTIEMSMGESWKIYSLTQAPGGPKPTHIFLEPSDNFRLLGSFAPRTPPKVEYSKEFEMQIETFEKKVTWSVPVELTKSLQVGEVAVRGYLEGLACAGQCVPFGQDETQFEAATVSRPEMVKKLLASRKLDRTHAKVRAWLADGVVTPGDETQLFVAFEPESNWHVYAYSKEPIQFQSPTLAQLRLPAEWKQGEGKSAAKIISKQLFEDDPPVREYHGPATIAFPISIPSTASNRIYPISGRVAFQTCSTQCDPPVAFAWNAEIEVSTEASDNPKPVNVLAERINYQDVVDAIANSKKSAAVGPLKQGSTKIALTPVPDSQHSPRSDKQLRQTADTPVLGVTQKKEAGEVSSSAFDLSQADFDTDKQASNMGLGGALCMALVGGFVLNFMPCVLPVIGLKVMSFVDQAGSDRRKVLLLNGTYVLGILSIFWVLAGLSMAGIGWGEQFDNRTFLISLISLVFAMALSFFGVWEIPIPGFATSQKAAELTETQGILGAFFKGVITTLLATPCGAPFFGVAYGFAVQSRNPLTATLIFTCVGLGMGLPYLIIGAFPRLMRFLPKPGAWMETFKQLMGFVLLGTVVFLMQSLQFKDILPVVGFLFGLWLACWWIGRVPFTAPVQVRRRAWAIALMIGVVALAAAFSEKGLLGHASQKYRRAVSYEVAAVSDATQTVAPQQTNDNHLAWEVFNSASVNKMIRNGETVMIDFTGDRCLNCRVMESTVLNTKPIKEIVQKNRVRAVVADLGNKDPAIAELLVKLQGHNSIPFLAVFPSGNPENVIRFPGLYTSSALTEALEQAGPSRMSVASLPRPTATRTVERQPMIRRALP